MAAERRCERLWGTFYRTIDMEARCLTPDGSAEFSGTLASVDPRELNIVRFRKTDLAKYERIDRQTMEYNRENPGTPRDLLMGTYVGRVSGKRYKTIFFKGHGMFVICYKKRRVVFRR